MTLLFIPPNSLGIVPVNKLDCNLNIDNSFIKPISLTIVPVNWLLANANVDNNDVIYFEYEHPQCPY